MDERIVIGGLAFVPMIDAAEIAGAVEGVAAMITRNYAAANPLVVCVLNGAALFHADLIRALRFELEADYIRVASYHGERVAGETLTFTAQPGTHAAGRNVILVEDIVDTGRTVDQLRSFYAAAGAASISVASLLYKPDADLVGRRPEFVGIEIPNRFVIGYGLDYQQQGRNLDGVFVLDDARGNAPPAKPSSHNVDQ